MGRVINREWSGPYSELALPPGPLPHSSFFLKVRKVLSNRKHPGQMGLTIAKSHQCGTLVSDPDSRKATGVDTGRVKMETG